MSGNVSQKTESSKKGVALFSLVSFVDVNITLLSSSRSPFAFTFYNYSKYYVPYLLLFKTKH